MTFDQGAESAIFKLMDGNERVISLRKQNAMIDERQVLIVIVKDCTDRSNWFESVKQQSQYSLIQDDLAKSMEHLTKLEGSQEMKASVTKLDL